jgi:hypothetical protein
MGKSLLYSKKFVKENFNAEVNMGQASCGLFRLRKTNNPIGTNPNPEAKGGMTTA